MRSTQQGRESQAAGDGLGECVSILIARCPPSTVDRWKSGRGLGYGDMSYVVGYVAKLVPGRG